MTLESRPLREQRLLFYFGGKGKTRIDEREQLCIILGKRESENPGTKRYVWRSVLVVVLLLVLTPFVYVEYNKYAYAERVKTYLVEEAHYKPEQIKSVTGVWSKKLPSFLAEVVFADESEVTYIYFAHNDVMQYGYVLTDEGKKRGWKEKDLKHDHRKQE